MQVFDECHCTVVLIRTMEGTVSSEQWSRIVTIVTLSLIDSLRDIPMTQREYGFTVRVDPNLPT